jgi:hypothetical protein
MKFCMSKVGSRCPLEIAGACRTLLLTVFAQHTWRVPDIDDSPKPTLTQQPKKKITGWQESKR